MKSHEEQACSPGASTVLPSHGWRVPDAAVRSVHRCGCLRACERVSVRVRVQAERPAAAGEEMVSALRMRTGPAQPRM